MQHDLMHPLGARVTGLPLTDAGPDEVAELKALLAEHGVVVLPGQDVDDEAFLGFLRQFGELTFSTGETPVEGFPDLNLISNVGRDTPPKSSFHVDTTYVAAPPAYTALRAVEIPERGGETLFTDQYAAYETLPADLRASLEGRSITHVVTGLELGEDDEASAEHPVFRPHPVTGRPVLYLTTAARCAAVTDLAPEEARATVATLLEHSTREENTLRHAWSPGDVVMWDNGCVMHRADHADVVGDRVMHRGMVAGY